MKKALIALGLILCLGVVSTAHARTVAKILNLRDENGTAITNMALTSGSAVNSETIDVRDNRGFITLLVTESHSSAVGDVDIIAEYSVDGTNWNEAYTTTSGATTKDDIVVTGLRNVTQWIVHTSRLSRYLRYKFDPDANSVITATVIFQRDK